MPDQRSADCERVIAANPPRLSPRAVAEVLDWGGRCPDIEEDRPDEFSLLPVAYAALAGSRDAAGCMLSWSQHLEHDGFAERTVFWRTLSESISGTSVSSENTQMQTLVAHILSGELLSVAQGEQMERYLIL